MPDTPATPPRVAVFVPDLSDAPDRRAAVAIAHALHRDGHPVDLVAPMGGGALRATLDPAIGQIDLAKRHAATSPLALARCLAERRPAVLAVPASVAWIARLAVRLARSRTPVVTVGGTDVEAALAAIRAATPRSG
ncbi:hypothetical protein J2847_000189 [Azospirillum agricola]|uniref:hypothetical protein n=1 Tax=Azospirillum agricola TaxID=1720247 RepID=UPI001AE70AA2|nr:hypothetical protein [Azospirillum agricola]MBP2226922.1 hypothetical protein [Azospirillum agricola]